MDAKRRLEVLMNHLQPPHEADSTLEPEECKGNETSSPIGDVTTDTLRKVFETLSMHDKQTKETLFTLYENDPNFTFDHGLTMDEQRERTFKQLKRISEVGIFSINDYKENPLKFLTAAELLNMFDVSLATKAGVHFALYGTAVMNLGTEKHKKWLDGVDNLETPGCFALTELGHGSNVRKIETTATYDHNTKEFILNSPTPTSQKYYIGNAAKHAQVGVVFAQLILDRKSYGVHGFVIRLREKDGSIVKGIQIEDCGHKIGLNGVDNGRIRFNQVRINKDSLLDKYGTINDDGIYDSPIKNSSERFASMLGTLVATRILVATGVNVLAFVGLAIAIRYSASRCQFNPPKSEEMPILDFLTHQRRLFPMLAKSVAFLCGSYHMKQEYINIKNNPDRLKDLHIIASGMKAEMTWHVQRVLTNCRECCGGQGYMSVNRIGLIKSDSDVTVTYEGDNTVLSQQVAAASLKEFQNMFSKGMLGVINFWSKEMTFNISDKNPVIKRNTNKYHLLSYSYHIKVFSFRERRLVRNLALSLRTKTNQGMSFFDAWNDCLDIVMSLSKATIERMLLEQYSAATYVCKEIGGSDNLVAKKLFKTLRSLFALSVIEENMGFFLSEGFFSKSKAKAISIEINTLCRMIRPYAVQIVDGFGIPDHLLGAPIIGDWKSAFPFK